MSSGPLKITADPNKRDTYNDVDVEKVKDYIISFYAQTRKLPSVENVAKHFRVTRYCMIEVFKILVHEGFLTMNATRYGISKSKLEPHSKMKVETKNVKDDSMVSSSWMLLAMRIILGIIAIGAICVSIYFTRVWLKDFLPPFLAVFLSSIMVLFSTMAFTIVVLLCKSGHWFFASMFFILWIFVLVFSMTSTVAGQYNQSIKLTNSETANDSDKVYKKTLYDSYVAEETSLQSQLDAKMSQKVPLQNLLNQYDSLEKREADGKTFNDLTRQMKALDSDISKLNSSLASVREKKRAYLESAQGSGSGLTDKATTENQTFYSWVASIFKNKVDPIYIQFWLSVFPAVFVDLIAPFALSFAFYKDEDFKRKKRRGNKTY